jgi:hypothetical protein
MLSRRFELKFFSAGVLCLSGALLTSGACGSKSPAAPTVASTSKLAPTPAAPANGDPVPTFRPTVAVRNVTSDGAGAKTYEFQIADASDFSTVIARQAAVAEDGSGTTSYTPDFDLQTTTRFYWRSRVTQGTTISDWSPTQNFTTPVMGYNRPGELYDPLVYGATVGVPVGSTTFIPGKGIRLNDGNSWVQYQLASPISSGEFSMEIEGLRPNGPGPKLKVFSMSDGTGDVFRSSYLLVAQYRGSNGNPDNSIAYKALLGDPFFKLEPDFGARLAGVMSLDPAKAYFWKGTWGNFFRLLVQDGVGGPTLYEHGVRVSDLGVSANAAFYNPTPHFAFLGANNGPFKEEDGSFPGAVYRNVWLSNKPRPASLGSALAPAQ